MQISLEAFISTLLKDISAETVDLHNGLQDQQQEA